MRTSSAGPRSSSHYTFELRVPNRSTMVGSWPSPAGLDSAARHHNRDLSLQQYLTLQEQHELLKQHLESLKPRSAAEPGIYHTHHTQLASPTSSFSSDELPPLQSEVRLPNGSPVAGSARADSWVVGREAAQRPEWAAPAATDFASDEAKLSSVNEGIKRTLTELLNCDAVRSDRSFRAWVQRRLLDAEKELRSERRRRCGSRPLRRSVQWDPDQHLSTHH
ncbi:hypothetical protein VTK73DRAFT_7898 [Phialemonium thermophilum]|uniref:Uncharacterized protein n=1 Tax=Phialemonium thermophilum TaxID=223376 RepID=A0ABR3WC19_9PEZI